MLIQVALRTRIAGRECSNDMITKAEMSMVLIREGQGLCGNTMQEVCFEMRWFAFQIHDFCQIDLVLSLSCLVALFQNPYRNLCHISMRTHMICSLK